jgi:hypothetical protein
VRTCLTILSAAILAFGAASCGTEAPVPTTAEERVAAYTLGLKAPVEVVDVCRFLDGGTTGFILQDCRSKPLEGCFDGRLGMPSPKRIFLGSLRPSIRHSHSLELGSKEESAVILLLECWLERTAEERATIDDRGWLPKDQRELVRNARAIERAVYFYKKRTLAAGS